MALEKEWLQNLEEGDQVIMITQYKTKVISYITKIEDNTITITENLNFDKITGQRITQSKMFPDIHLIEPTKDELKQFSNINILDALTSFVIKRLKEKNMTIDIDKVMQIKNTLAK